MRYLKYKNITLVAQNRLPRKKKKAAKKAIDMFAHQLVGNITFYFPGIKVNPY